MGRILGVILIVGGTLVGVVIVYLMSIYHNEGSLTTETAVLGATLGILILVLPQLGFGVFLFLQDKQEQPSANQPNEQSMQQTKQ